jgi:flagellar basal-body rod protein FlgG
MQIALEASLNGIVSLTEKQALIANNLANLDTTAFKRSSQAKADFMIPGTRVATTPIQFDQGDVTRTGEDLDMAIEGEGFFTVLRGGVLAYTRAGAFKKDRDGNLVTPQGDLVDPAIVIPADSERVEVGSDGTVYSVTGDGSQATAVGRLDAVRFQNPQGLIPVGDNLFIEGPDSGPPLNGSFGEEGFPTLRQRYLEQSNVDLTQEISDEMLTQRAFQANVRAFKTADEAIGTALDLFR